VYGEEPSASADRDPGGKSPWVGGAGHWAAWPMRVMLLPAVQFDETPSSGNGAGNDNTGTNASGFPVIFGRAFSMRFGQVSLNCSPSAAAQQAERLAASIPEDVRDKDPQFGWNGSGTSVTQSTEVARIDVRSADTAAVTLPASVNGRPIGLGVPGSPVAALPSAPQAALGRYIAPGTSISELGGAVSFDGISSLPVPQGGATRDTTMTVDLTTSDQVGAGSPRLVTTCDMSVIDQQSGRWYVRDIRASTQPMGTP
jgi:hypothetical protein